MAYNGFPATYQPMQYQPQNFMQPPQMQQPQMQSQPMSQQQNSPMIWVQGETGAKSYLLAPNTTLPLWDSENQTIYLKSTDASGMPSMKVLDYTIRDTSQQPTQKIVNIQKNDSNNNENEKIDYVTHEELKNLEDKIADRFKEIKEIMEDTGA